MGTATINLKAAASNLPDRSTKGTVMLVLDDTLEGIEKYNRKKAVSNDLEPSNKKLIYKMYDMFNPAVVKVVCYDSSNSETIATALEKIDGVKFNYLACPTATLQDDKKLIADFIEEQKRNKNYTVKACLNNYQADSEDIISNYINTITIDGETVSGAVFAVYHACMRATCGTKQSLGNKILDKVTAVTLIDDSKSKDPEAIADMGHVGVVYDNDFEKFVLTDDVNTKITINYDTENDLLKDARAAEILCMIQDDLKMDFKSNWSDKLGNSYSARKKYCDDTNSTYFKNLMRNGTLNPDMPNKYELNLEKTREYLETNLHVDTTDMTDDEILAYDIGGKVFTKIRVYILQNMKELVVDLEY